jgi:methyltransferase
MHLHIGIWPWVIMGTMIAQRLGELVISARHVPRVRALGGREYGVAHFPFIVAVHVLFPLLLITELAHHHVQPGPAWPLWLVVWVLAQALRYAAIHALGDRWNVRVWVVPGMAPVRSGPYRWLRHPNYVAVVMEFIAAPMMFGAWRTAIVISLLNAAALTVRIRCENQALQRAAVESSR